MNVKEVIELVRRAQLARRAYEQEHERWAAVKVQIDLTRREIGRVCDALADVVDDYQDQHQDAIYDLIGRLREAQNSP